MATFELWPPRSDKNFNPNGSLDLAVPGANFFTPQLKLKVEESETVALSGQTLTKLSVVSVPPGIVKIERISEPQPGTTVYKITGVAKGIVQVEAKLPVNSGPAPTVSTTQTGLKVDVWEQTLQEEDADFLSGFQEGISASAGDSAILLMNKIRQDPNGFSLAVHIGCAKGLLEGLVSLAQLLATILKIGLNLSPIGIVVNTGRYAFDQKFREDVLKHLDDAKKVALALAELIAKLSSVVEQSKLMRAFKIHGRVIGKIVGEEVGKEIKEELTRKSAKEIGEWIGFIIGRVMFEVIFLIATEGIGTAASAAKATGEGAGIAARLGPRLRGLLRPLIELTEFLKARIGTKVAIDAAELAAINSIRMHPDFARLSIEEVAAIRSYTGDGWAKINLFLRDGAGDTKTAAEAKSLISGLNKLPGFTGKLIRSESLTPADALAQYRQGQVFKPKGMLSTSRGGAVAQREGNVAITIHAAGKNGKDITKASVLGAGGGGKEAEILFAPGTSFNVERVTEIGQAVIVVLREI